MKGSQVPVLNTPTQFGRLTRVVHWLTACLIALAVVLGFVAVDAPFDTPESFAAKVRLFSLHKTLGVALFCLALLRVVLRFSQSHPGTPEHHSRTETFLAQTTHWLLYVMLIAVPLTGWVQHAASEGAAPLYWPFGLGVDMVPQSQWLFDVASAMHFVTGRLLLLSIALHVLGALKHALVDRDGLLTRMISGREVSAPLGAKPKSKGAIWVTASATFAALLLGWVFAQTSSSAPLVKFETAKPEQATWQVLDGTISISVLQLGAEVTGHFENWTADIVFAESASPGQVGQVTTRIDMSSIHLGSVSTQVKGPDFFDSAQFPTAEFRAVINATDENYVAKGHLALKGTEIPVRFPFAMTITDGIAKMSGRTTLDRRDFQIGMNMTDPTQLGFDVQVNLALTAQRQE